MIREEVDERVLADRNLDDALMNINKAVLWSVKGKGCDVGMFSVTRETLQANPRNGISGRNRTTVRANWTGRCTGSVSKRRGTNATNVGIPTKIYEAPPRVYNPRTIILLLPAKADTAR